MTLVGNVFCKLLLGRPILYLCLLQAYVSNKLRTKFRNVRKRSLSPTVDLKRRKFGKKGVAEARVLGFPHYQPPVEEVSDLEVERKLNQLRQNKALLDQERRELLRDTLPTRREVIIGSKTRTRRSMSAIKKMFPFLFDGKQVIDCSRVASAMNLLYFSFGFT